uniref:RNA-editing substrate-binding complex 6 protein domain-containing protein n=1 Tax=Chromera velia CCMP2878 TaxID=1169474 RepID=A0A0G4HA47_9ALVE|eukprot:Cvel_25440.t1-p1 / transcript=Cvel_25440.t1 / gene=Cvel_25440 / organism=Chromera_velia_CCMP2878 / gene_product=hypothetical protein / transcript_product=hypothetical protein / location=Cvel_scaffold2882:5062-11414(+) / protein_length=967 / sequence_SO=supercontig / SO=protein_coding / is_pseudo=false
MLRCVPPSRQGLFSCRLLVDGHSMAVCVRVLKLNEVAGDARRSIASLVRDPERHKHVPFGEMWLPKSRQEKTQTAQLMDVVPWDLVGAVEERNQMVAKADKLPPQFKKILQRYGSDPVTELMGAFMRLVIEKDLHRDRSVWLGLLEDLDERLHDLTASEAGVILKCLVKTRKVASASVGLRRHAERLVKRVCARGQTFTRHGVVFALNGVAMFSLQGMQAEVEHLCGILVRHADLFEISILARACNSLAQIPSQSAVDTRVVETFSQLSIHLQDAERKYPEGRRPRDSTEGAGWSATNAFLFANAFARKGFLDGGAFRLLETKLMGALQFLQPDELAGCANAFAKLGPASEVDTVGLFKALAEEALRTVPSLSVRNLAVLSNAFAQACILHEALFRGISDTLVHLLDECAARQLVMVAHAFVKVGLVTDPLLPLLWRRACVVLDDFSWLETALLVQAYTKSGAPDTGVILRLAEWVGERLDREDREGQEGRRGQKERRGMEEGSGRGRFSLLKGRREGRGPEGHLSGLTEKRETATRGKIEGREEDGLEVRGAVEGEDLWEDLEVTVPAVVDEDEDEEGGDGERGAVGLSDVPLKRGAGRGRALLDLGISLESGAAEARRMRERAEVESGGETGEALEGPAVLAMIAYSLSKTHTPPEMVPLFGRLAVRGSRLLSRATGREESWGGRGMRTNSVCVWRGSDVANFCAALGEGAHVALEALRLQGDTSEGSQRAIGPSGGLERLETAEDGEEPDVSAPDESAKLSSLEDIRAFFDVLADCLLPESAPASSPLSRDPIAPSLTSRIPLERRNGKEGEGGGPDRREGGDGERKQRKEPRKEGEENQEQNQERPSQAPNARRGRSKAAANILREIRGQEMVKIVSALSQAHGRGRMRNQLSLSEQQLFRHGNLASFLVRHCVLEIPSLSFVPITRVMAALGALRVYDEDLMSALLAAQQKKKRTPRLTAPV